MLVVAGWLATHFPQVPHRTSVSLLSITFLRRKAHPPCQEYLQGPGMQIQTRHTASRFLNGLGHLLGSAPHMARAWDGQVAFAMQASERLPCLAALWTMDLLVQPLAWWEAVQQHSAGAVQRQELQGSRSKCAVGTRILDHCHFSVTTLCSSHQCQLTSASSSTREQ